jgi:alpha-amylase
VADDLAALDLADGTEVRYRASLEGSTVVSNVRTVVVGAAPQPDSVTVAGSLNSEMGCPDDWQPACEAAFMACDPADRLWKLTADLPAGQYEFKAAINGFWDENYGQDGAPNGSNIVLNHDGGPVTFRYDHTTHVITAG